ncbi:MAG: carbohydrate binding domain-containing protein [bacterium]
MLFGTIANRLHQQLIGLSALAVMSLGLVMPAKSLAATNLVTNNSFETATGNIATGWTGSGWGTNTSTVSIQTSGAQDRANAAYVTMANRTSGDVKWRFNQVAVNPSTTYTFTDWYQSNVTTELDAEVLMADGTTQYFWLGEVAPSTTWKQSSVNFTAPANASKVSIIHVLFSNGWLKTDNYSFSTFVAPPPPVASTTILNPSMETGTATTITNWVTSYWGSLTPTFSVKPEGSDGVRSAYVNVSNYVSGDAKWVFDPIVITPGSTYEFKDSYKSSVPSDIVAAITATDGTTSYQYMGNVPASATSWASVSKTLTMPATASKVSIYHLLSANGWLQTDNYSLALYVAPPPPPIPPAGTNLVLNQSMELGTASMINNWTKSSWGSLTPAFSVKTAGAQDGARSSYIKVTNYVSGDAKWQTDPISVQPSKTYVFSDWYKSNVATEVDAIITLADGTQSIRFLGTASLSSTAWSQFSRTITMPTTAKSVTLTHIIYSNGWLQADNVSFAEQKPVTPPAIGDPFYRPMISLEMDDGWASAYQYGLPVFESFGYKPTQYVITGSVNQPDYMTSAQVIDWSNRAYIGSHTVSHPHLPTLTQAQITNELTTSKTFLQNLTGKPINLFVTPYCESNTTVSSIAKTLYQSLRNCDTPVNVASSFDRYNLQSYVVLNTTTDADILSYIANAKATNGWLILVWHQVAGDIATEPYSVSATRLQHQLQLVKDSGLYVTNTQAALNEELGIK